MKFAIFCSDKSVQTYDNLTNKIEVPEGYSLNSDFLKENLPNKYPKSFAKPFDFEGCEPLTKNKKVKKIRIFVGSNCNYKCSFCIQKDHKFSSKVMTKKDVDDFFKRFDAAGIEYNEKNRIEIWGGEPLVYWKTLKVLIPELRRRYPKANIQTISNGTLMRDEILDFFIEHRVALSFSHDAQAYFLRGEDPLNDPKLLAMQKKVAERYKEADLPFGLNVVISQYNCDLQAMEKFFDEKLPGVQYGYEGVVMAHSPSAVEFCNWLPQQQDLFFTSIRNAIFNEPKSRTFNALSYRLNEILGRIVHGIDNRTIRAKCDSVNPGVLNFDLSGNVLSCHNVAEDNWIIGSIDDIDGIRCNSFKHWSRRFNCPSCPFIVGCFGRCSRDSDACHLDSCRVEYMFQSFLFWCAWKLLTGTNIVSIDAITDPKLTSASIK